MSGIRADSIAVVHTPRGGYGDAFPGPVLAACRAPLVAGAPDLRALWQVAEVVAGGVIHDMRCDGTEANGVNDVDEFDLTTAITVVVTYEDGMHVLRPVGLPIEVTRRRDGDDLMWKYRGFTARLARLGPPDLARPA